MPKLIVQIPCYNEEETLAATLADLPRSVEGFDTVEWLVIDDGSTDRTVDVAWAGGVDHLVRHPSNRGLARAFMSGIEASLLLGADVIVNTDADNQYDASCIPDLVAPIRHGEAQIVIGSRPIKTIASFSPLKKLLQRIGSRAVARISGTTVEDAPSGFRAIHRDAAVVLNVLSPYTYTLETIIQAGLEKLPIRSVPIRVHPVARPSRLVRSSADYVRRSIRTMFRIYLHYEPLRFFSRCSVALALPAVALGLRFLYLYATGDGDGHVQSLILAAVLATGSFLTAMAGVLADLTATNRAILGCLRTRRLRQEILSARGQSPEDIGRRAWSLLGVPLESSSRTSPRPQDEPI